MQLHEQHDDLLNVLGALVVELISRLTTNTKALSSTTISLRRVTLKTALTKDIINIFTEITIMIEYLWILLLTRFLYLVQCLRRLIFNN